MNQKIHAPYDIKEFSKFKKTAPSFPIFFYYDDSIITVVSKDGFIRKYDIVKDMKSGEGVIDK